MTSATFSCVPSAMTSRLSPERTTELVAMVPVQSVSNASPFAVFSMMYWKYGAQLIAEETSQVSLPAL